MNVDSVKFSDLKFDDGINIFSLGSYHFLAHGGRGAGGNEGDRVKIIDQKGDQEKIMS